MIKLIVGNKGTGKTKILIEMVNGAVETTQGNVVCLDKGVKLTYDLNHSVRLVDVESYKIDNYEKLYGFIAGLLAGNYDIQEIYMDGILKTCGRNYDELGGFFDKINELTKESDVKLVFTVSADQEELPEAVKKYI